MAEDLPKKDLLIKLMGMTGSSNDNEALMALRKASELLRSAGWTWQSLIEGKIKVIEDPFKSIFDPSANQKPRAPARDFTPPPPPPPRQPQPKPAQGNSSFQYAGAQTGRWSAGGGSSTGRTISPHSTKVNIYKGICYCCGLEVQPSSGFIFNPHSINRGAADKWKILCAHCNNTAAPILASPAKRVFPTSPDLGSL